MAFHILLELKNQFKLCSGAAIAVTFTVDFLLGMIISNNTEKQATDGLDDAWSQSPSFYIICFLDSLLRDWSILLDSCAGMGQERNHQ